MVVAARSAVTEYAERACSGEIVIGKLVALACERHIEDLKTGPERGLSFDEDAAQRAIEFFEFLPHVKGEWAGRPFRLGAWQQFIVGSIFGWKREYGQCPQCNSWLPLDPLTRQIACRGCFDPNDDEEQIPAETGWFRRFRTAHMEVARKNGKSTLAAGIGLLGAFFDGEPGAEVYSAATKRDQAKIIWGTAREMVRRSPDLSQIDVLVANLSDKSSGSKFEPLASDVQSTDGLNSAMNLVDELHAHKTRGLWDVLITGMGARRQPLTFATTTAGYDRNSICWEQREFGVQVLQGAVKDDSYFVYIACIDEGDDWSDPACWLKANPNLGVSVKLEYLETQCAQAEHMPAKQNTFQRLHCNRWTQQVDRWIDVGLWDECAGTWELEDLRPRNAYGGLDLGSVSDLSAWVMIFPRDDDPEEIDVLARFWCPESVLTDGGNRYAALYQEWVAEGFLTTTPGNATDYHFIRDQILEDAAEFALVDLAVDRLFQAHQIAMELGEELGWERVVGMGQGFMSMASPTKEFERRLLQGKIHHAGNPALRWMADNVAVRQDPAGNLKVDKAESQGKVDGIVALIMALDRAMRHVGDEAGAMFV